MEDADWEQFALNEAPDEDAEFFLQFAEDELHEEHSDRVQTVKARIAAEQPLFLQEVARFNARPQQNFTAAPYPNGFSLATH